MVYLLVTQKIQSHKFVRGIENPDNADPSFYYHLTFGAIAFQSLLLFCCEAADTPRSHLAKLNSH